MKFLPFFETFPALSQSELRNIFITERNPYPLIPVGNYAFLEMFCPDIDCDCRKVIIPIVSINPNKTWAILHYGWACEKHYQRWWGKNHDGYRPLSGAYFDPPTDNPLQQAFLELFKQMIESDPHYAQRIERHYQMFKKAMRKKLAK